MTAELRRTRDQWRAATRHTGWMPRAAVITLGVATAGLLAWVLLRAHPLDLSVFLRAGGDVRAGRNPYPTVGTPAVWSGSAFVYPWVVALPFAGLGVLPKVAAVAVFRVASIAAVVIGCRLAGVRSSLAVLAVVGSSVSLLGLQRGTLDAVLFMGVVVAWRLRDRPALLAVVLAGLVVSELFMWPLLVWAWLTRRRRAAVLGGLLSAAVILAGSAVGEPLPSYLRSLSELGRHEGSHSVSLFALGTHAGLPTIYASALAVLAALTVLGVAVVVERRTGRPVGLTGALVAALVAMPILWSHYLLLLALSLLLAATTDSTRLALLGVFDVGSWLRYTPYRATLPEAFVGTAVAVLVLGLAVWEMPSRRSVASGLIAVLRRFPVALYSLAFLFVVLAVLANGRGGRIVVVQVAILIVGAASTAFGAAPAVPAALAASPAAAAGPPRAGSGG